MVEFITGIKGIGKTKILSEAAVITAQQSKGNVIYIDCSDKLSLELPSNIRLININDYGIKSAVAFYGFLTGLCAGDYDLTDVFVDSTMDIFSGKTTDINDFLDIVTRMSNRVGVNFHFSIYDSQEKEPVYQYLND